MRKPPRGLWDHLKRPAPRTLYHYTSLETLQKIIETKSLLASDARFLNDTKEITHFTQTLTNRISLRLKAANDDKKPALKWLLDRLNDVELDPVYVVSFSQKGDDLSQWRGYTPPGQGVCIGFDPKALRRALSKLKIGATEKARYLLLGKVIYLNEDEGASFDEFIDSACGYLDVISGEIVRSVSVERLIVSAMPFYKHSAFMEEKEWRVRMSADLNFLNDPLPVEYRIGKSMLIPSTRLSFKDTQSEKTYIKEVIVGPTPERDLSLQSVRELLKTYDLSIASDSVRLSKTPYRNW